MTSGNLSMTRVPMEYLEGRFRHNRLPARRQILAVQASIPARLARIRQAEVQRPRNRVNIEAEQVQIVTLTELKAPTCSLPSLIS